MSNIDSVLKTLDKVRAAISESGVFEDRSTARQLKDRIQKQYDALPADDKKTLRKRVDNSLMSLKSFLKKPNKPDIKNRARGGSISKLKAGGFPDMSGDGKVTKKDILIGRGVVKKQKGGAINGLKKMGMNKGGLAGRLAQRGYGKARS